MTFTVPGNAGDGSTLRSNREHSQLVDPGGDWLAKRSGPGRTPRRGQYKLYDKTGQQPQGSLVSRIQPAWVRAFTP